MSCEIPLSRGFSALVDDEDHEWLSRFKWSVQQPNPQRQIHYAVRRQTVSRGHAIWVTMHRQILRPVGGLEVDHINRNGLDNRRCNLRLATRTQNLQNAAKHRGGTSHFKGVCWSMRHHNWRATIKASGHYIHLGYFEDEIEAAIAYDRAALAHFGEFARPNFIHLEEAS